MSNSLKIILLILFPALLLNAEEPEKTLEKLKLNRALIENACLKTGVSPEYLEAVIYVERTENFTWEDDAVDELLARSGLNSSIGFCQVKIKTAYFIEKTLNQPYLPVSFSPDELIIKLQNDSLNILYAAGYLKLMINRWSVAGFDISNRPDILGTLYSAGLYYRDGRERKPNQNPKPNEFGKKVNEALNCNLISTNRQDYKLNNTFKNKLKEN